MLARIICFIAIVFTCSTLHAAPSKQKTVLITGGMSGLGRDIAVAFKKDGWNVWVTSRDPNQYPELAGVTVRRLDVTDQAAVKKLMQEIQAKDGHLDVLVNNAGYGVLGATETVSVSQARALLDVNVIGPYITMQEAIPLMRANHGGHIINISSSSGIRALPGIGIYSASKMALEGLSEAIAAEIAHWNIKVSIIEPSTLKNDWTKNALDAENIAAFPGYKTFNNNLRTSLINKAIDVGQNPVEVAELTVKVANTPKPDLRYQTNTTVSALAHEILVDPTGNKMRDMTIARSKELYENQF